MTDGKERNRGRLLVVSAALLWSTSGVLVKAPALVSYQPAADQGLLIALWRAALGALILAPLVPWRRVVWRPGLLLLIASFASMNITFIAAMTRADAGDVILLQYTSPIFVMIASVLWLGEPLQRRNLGALILAMAGVAVVLVGGWNQTDPIALLLALAAGVSYAGVILSLRWLKDVDSLYSIFLCQIGSVLLLLPWAVPHASIPVSAAQWGAIGVLAAFQVVLPYVFFARGLASVAAQEASLLTLVEPVFNPLWVLLMWGNPVRNSTIVGGALILAALALRFVSRPAPKG
jgi:DME family drug/metabolite transporter